mgnify:CR=1 FL=1
MDLAKYFDSLRAAQEVRKAAMQKVLAAIDELAAADEALDQTLSQGIDLTLLDQFVDVDSFINDMMKKVPNEISAVLKFGNLF